MKNLSRRATDSIELCALILEIYEKAKADNLYIIDRGKSNAFGIIFREMETSYEPEAIPFERFYPQSSVKIEERDVYEYSSDSLKKVEEYEAFLKEMSSKNPKDEIEAQDIVLKIEDFNDTIKDIKPELVKRKMPLYINNVTGLECPLIALQDMADDDMKLMAEFTAGFILHEKAFINGREQREPLMIEFANITDWADAFVI